MLKRLLETMAKALVDDPEKVIVSQITGHETVILEIRAAQRDVGKIIGKQGRTVAAMRSILDSSSTKLRKRAILAVIEPKN
jgi:uncharacterized protein